MLNMECAIYQHFRANYLAVLFLEVMSMKYSPQNTSSQQYSGCEFRISFHWPEWQFA